MSWLNRIGRRLEPFAIPHLALILVAGQLFVLVAAGILRMLDAGAFVLVAGRVLDGEWWRLPAFIFMPPFFSPAPGAMSLVWSVFGLYMIYLFGSALENYWGKLRFNLFLLCGYALTVGFAFITPGAAVTNIFISGSLFLAFAWLNPEFEILLFFILPVKIKWIALITWLGYAFTFLGGGLSVKLSIVASVGNFLVFFSRDILQRARSGRRRMQTQAERFARQGDTSRVRNRCYVCGKTSETDPLEDFRFCSKCEGDYCYCSAHLHNHTHIRAATAKPGAPGLPPPA
jgi:hypothetical protein